MNKIFIINYINKKGIYKQLEFPINDKSGIESRSFIEALNNIVSNKQFIKDVDIITEAFISEE